MQHFFAQIFVHRVCVEFALVVKGVCDVDDGAFGHDMIENESLRGGGHASVEPVRHVADVIFVGHGVLRVAKRAVRAKLVCGELTLLAAKKRGVNSDGGFWFLDFLRENFLD